MAPGSPAEKEYALPLNQARQTGSTPSSRGSGSSTPHTSSRPGSGETALFGAGIKPPRGGGGSGPGKSSEPRPERARPHGVQRAAAVSAPSDPAITHALRDSGGGGDGSTLALIGGAVAILVLGAFGGTVLRHSRRPST